MLIFNVSITFPALSPALIYSYSIEGYETYFTNFVYLIDYVLGFKFLLVLINERLHLQSYKNVRETLSGFYQHDKAGKVAFPITNRCSGKEPTLLPRTHKRVAEIEPSFGATGR